VPTNDLGRALAAQREDLHRVIDAVLARAWLVHGPEHAAFERDLAAYVGVAHAVGVASGTDALELALRAVRSDCRDVVVTVANAGGYASVAARRAGLRVRYCDVDPGTHLLDLAHLAGVLDAEVCAVVVTHLYGRLADVAAVRAVVEPWGAAVVEDCAQAFGAVHGGARGGVGAGALGDAAAFSTKNLGGIGDGGMVLTRNTELADKIRALRVHGESRRYYYDAVGGNFRLDAIQAAALRVKLRHFDDWQKKRRALADAYSRKFREAGLAGAGGIILPEAVYKGSGAVHYHTYHQYVIRTDDRDGLQTGLKERGIGTAIYYPLGLHLQKCFADLGYRPGDFPVTEKACREVLALPIYPELSENQQDDVVAGIGEYFRKS